MGNYCGKLFAELGADVVLVEPLDGSPSRRLPPFAGDEPGVENSLTFFAHNTSKRGVQLNLDTARGQEILRELAADADLVIETESPGTMRERGLDHASLGAKNPALVTTSITAFGQTGPYADYPADDLTCLAMGGLLQLAGYADGPPVRPADDQAYAVANLFAAVSSMLAVTGAELTGRGQHVDVSVQECVTMALENAVQFYDLEGVVRRRHAGQQRSAGYGVFPCADGYIYLIGAGIGGNRFWRNLVAWLTAEQVDGVEQLGGDEWDAREFVESEAAKSTFAAVFEPYARARTKAHLYEEAQRWRVPLCPVSSPAEVVRNRQLAYREFFVSIPAFGRSGVQVPGAPYVLSETPWRLRGLAPSLGQHTDEVLSAAGYADELSALRVEGVIE
ncbi:MAG: CoA transferase [Streptosporangiales bacterium]|nr:CoA transferase [Streptosporangiales bacterium]